MLRTEQLPQPRAQGYAKHCAKGSLPSGSKPDVPTLLSSEANRGSILGPSMTPPGRNNPWKSNVAGPNLKLENLRDHQLCFVQRYLMS